MDYETTIPPQAALANGDDGVEFFQRLYEQEGDPWHVDVSWYEQRKHQLTVAALPRWRYHRAMEPGCSTGALTELLAPRCDELFAFDIVDQAVQRARERTQDLDHVHVLNATFPDYLPYGTGDLVVWSEIAYYLSDVGWDSAIAGLDSWLDTGGHLVTVHYTADDEKQRHGASIGRRLDELDFLERTAGLVDEHFDLGVWVRRPREMI